MRLSEEIRQTANVVADSDWRPTLHRWAMLVDALEATVADSLQTMLDRYAEIERAEEAAKAASPPGPLSFARTETAGSGEGETAGATASPYAFGNGARGPAGRGPAPHAQEGVCGTASPAGSGCVDAEMEDGALPAGLAVPQELAVPQAQMVRDRRCEICGDEIGEPGQGEKVGPGARGGSWWCPKCAALTPSERIVRRAQIRYGVEERSS